MGSIIRTIGTIIYSLLYFNSRLGLNWQKYLYSVISVIDKRLPGNTGARQAEGLYAQSRRAPQGSDQSFHGVQISQPPFLLFPLFIALFSEIGQSFYPFFLRSDVCHQKSEIGQLVRTLSDLRFLVGDIRSQKNGKWWGKGWLKSLETLVRHLWRAAGSKAEAPPLAVHPKVGHRSVRGWPSAIFRILGGLYFIRSGFSSGQLGLHQCLAKCRW